ncbi:MAG: S-layer homology domain-containing protein [Lutispora sp.]|jgi:hypothetical protein|uniref:S-layer homology domain-containing protein n=1 Tax=Lutispora sp. TaxID=2828727 RepID=UPI0035686864
MKKIKMTAICLSTAIALSSITAPVMAHADKGKAKGKEKNQITIKLDKSKNIKIAPGQIKFMFADSEQYKDVFSWALKSIEKLGAKGIISGYGDKCYRPQNKVTNLEALTLILKLTDHKEDAEKNDRVHSYLTKYQNQWGIKWGWGYLYVAVEEGILLPEEIKDFNPNQPIKRHELAKYLVRAMGMTKEAEKHMDSKLDFKDANAIPKGSRGYVYVINDLEIMTGNEKKQFKPNEPLTRAEIAVSIDRAEDYLDNDADDENEAEVVFQSYDDNKLTVKHNGKTVSYKTIDDVIVYKDKEYTNVDDLEKGDVLEVVFNSSKQVIFIEVIGEVEVEDEDEDKDEDREDVKFYSVSYNNLPDAIKDKIDVKRVSKGYEAYEYDDEIYLVAYMGKKSTGGYAIEIEDVERYKVNSNYIVEATVVETKPGKGSIVTQALTYPYDVVKFNNFDKLGRIYFVDEEGTVIARKSIEDLDETTTATGYFSKIDGVYIYIKAKSGSALTKYELSEDVLVYINNKEKELEDLKDGMEVKLTILNDYVTKISADYNIKEAEGTVQLIDSDKNQIRLKYDNKLTTYTLADDVEILLDGEEAKLSDLEFGMKAELELLNNKVIKVNAVNFEESFEGKVRDVEISKDEVKSITILVDNTRMKFDITKDTYFDMLDEDAEPTDLAINSVVEINLLNGKVLEVIEIK